MAKRGRITVSQLIKILQELDGDAPVVLWLDENKYAFAKAVYTLHLKGADPQDTVGISCDDEPLPTVSAHGVVANAVYITTPKSEVSNSE